MGLEGLPQPRARPVHRLLSGEDRRRPGSGLSARWLRASGGLLSTHSGPAESRSLLLFNIHLEKLNLASWKPAHRVKFLATSKVFHFPGPAMLWFPLVEASEQPGSRACLAFPSTATRLPPCARRGRKEGPWRPRQAAQRRLGSTCPGRAPRSHPAGVQCPVSLRWQRQPAVPAQAESERGLETSWKIPATLMSQ